MEELCETISVPKCWKELIKKVFPVDLKDILSERHCVGIDDPNPYYDDFREVSVHFSNGVIGYLGLISGQANYFGGITLLLPSGEGIESDPLERWDDREELEAGNCLYVFNIQWV